VTIYGPRWRGLGLLFALLLVAACAAPTIRKSPNDDRSYAYRVLDNGLEVVLVSDPSADKSAAALTVFRGSFDDPPGRGGLAHFLEHMLFLGTEKYPETDGYQQFIAVHGGTHNAYTAGDHTNYFFDVQPDHFEPALDQFAQFFIAPLFDAAYVDREKNAVDSEYQLYLKDDSWRGFHVEKQVMNPVHPAAAFTVGSLDTLAGDVRGELIRFYETHYSADQMALVVVARDDLDTLAGWVDEKFSAVPRRTLAPSAALPPLYAPDTLPAELSYQTIKDTHRLTLNFPLPGLDAYYRVKPAEYLAELLGHEGDGSLHALLRSRGWIESLSTGAGRIDADNGMLTVDIELTEEGAAHQAEITQLVFETIALIRDQGIARWRYEEQARLAELAFRFAEKQSPLGTAYSIAPNLRLYPARDVLEAPLVMERFEPRTIAAFAAPLEPDNVLIEVADRSVEGNRREPYFDVPYRVDPIADQRSLVATQTTPDLALPARNPFVPKALDLIGTFDELPRQVVDQPGIALWLARDTSFGVPRANAFFAVQTPDSVTSPSARVHAILYARLVEDALNRYAYPATIAGLSYSVAAGSGGFRISMFGFDDKQPVLLDRVLETFAQLDIDDKRLAIHREELQRELANFSAERPFQQAYAALSHLLVSDAWPPAMLNDALARVTLESMSAFRATQLTRLAIRGLLHGNVGVDDAQAIARTLAKRLPITRIDASEPRVAPIAGVLSHRLDAINEDAAMVLYVQGRDESFAERACYGLAAQILAAPYFNELRTERQLGYVVFTRPAVLRRTPGISFVVQSPVADAQSLINTTTDFLTEFRSTIAAMTPVQFDAHKQGLLTKLLEQDKNLAARGARYWADLDVGFTEFDSRERIAAQIRDIDQPGFLHFFDGLIARAGTQRLVVYSPGRFATKESADVLGVPIDDVAAFKQG